MRKVPDKFILYHQSLDAYLYLRFLRIIIFICFVGCCLTWPILMPVNATGGGSLTELDKVGIGNVKKRGHLYAHAIIAWVFFSFVMFTVAASDFGSLASVKPGLCRSLLRTAFLHAPFSSYQPQEMHSTKRICIGTLEMELCAFGQRLKSTR